MNTEQKRSLTGIVCLLLRLLYAIGSNKLRQWVEKRRKATEKKND
jgi:hypothetical protein